MNLTWAETPKLSAVGEKTTSQSSNMSIRVSTRISYPLPTPRRKNRLNKPRVSGSPRLRAAPQARQGLRQGGGHRSQLRLLAVRRNGCKPESSSIQNRCKWMEKQMKILVEGTRPGGSPGKSMDGITKLEWDPISIGDLLRKARWEALGKWMASSQSKPESSSIHRVWRPAALKAISNWWWNPLAYVTF